MDVYYYVTEFNLCRLKCKMGIKYKSQLFNKPKLEHMKFFKTLLIIVAIAFNVFNCSNEKKTNNEVIITEEKLLQTIDKFNRAFKEGNIIVLKTMIAENYLHTNENSKAIRKKDWFNYLNKREKKIKSGHLEVIEYKMDEMEIEFYENTAIVTAKIAVSNKENGEIQKSEYRVTNVWVIENGNWERAGFHDGKIK